MNHGFPPNFETEIYFNPSRDLAPEILKNTSSPLEVKDHQKNIPLELLIVNPY